MAESRFRKESRRPATIVAVVAALSVLLSGCGGTRQSDEAIERAAGVRPPSAAGSAIVDGMVADGVGVSPAPGDSEVSGTAAAPGPAAGAPGVGAGGGDPGRRTAPGGGANLAGAGDTTVAGVSEGSARGAGSERAGGPVTRKSVVRLGAVGTFSGPVGGLVKDTVTGIRVWAQAVNAAGGVNGHPVDVLVGDDGGDPARFNSLLQQFVEQEGVQAFLYTTLGFAPAGNNKYLDSKKIFTFSTEGGLEVAYQNPYVLTATPTGLTNADSMILAFGKGIKAAGGVKLASFACSDFGLCDNFDQRWSSKDVLDKAGFTLVARGRPSLTQPDYTSQCLAAKQAGAEAIILALDGAAIRRFAGDCARQNYRPILATADIVVTRDLPGDKNVDGLFIGTKMAPFADLRVPGIKEAHAAFARYAPGLTVTGGLTNGWIIGEFFAQAARNLPDKQTLKDIEDGLYSIRNNTLKGMTYPITMTRGKPVARQLCYGVATIAGDKFGTAPGPSLYCEKNGKALANPSDYGIA